MNSKRINTNWFVKFQFTLTSVEHFGRMDMERTFVKKKGNFYAAFGNRKILSKLRDFRGFLID